MESITQNLELYNRYRAVPKEAQKTITGGRLNGMTDINPMWRIQCLTEAFGPCGIGWYAEVLDERIEDGADGEKMAHVKAALYIKTDGEWSKPIVGVGGSMLVTKERTGLRTSDEAYKMAYTDAISVCCKMLGFGADIYWAAGRTKYTVPEPKPEPKEQPKVEDDIYFRCARCGEILKPYKDSRGRDVPIRKHAERSKDLFGQILCLDCINKEAAGDGE